MRYGLCLCSTRFIRMQFGSAKIRSLLPMTSYNVSAPPVYNGEAAHPVCRKMLGT